MMKKLFHSLALLTALLLPLELFGQSTASQEEPSSPIPMFAEGAKWSVSVKNIKREWEPGYYHWVNEGENYQYGVQGKESFNGKEYFHVVTTKGTERVDFYAREEGTKVYLYQKSTDREFVLFDYAIKPGDKYIGMGGSPENEAFYEEFTLESIETKLIAGENRRVYYFSYEYPSQSHSNTTREGYNYPNISYTNIHYSPSNAYMSLVWVEGIGTLEDSPFYTNKTMTGSKPQYLLGYTDAKGVQHALSNQPADFTWRVVISSEPTALDNVESAPASIHMKEGVLSVDLRDGKLHRLSVYSLDGVRLLPETSFTDSFSAPLAYFTTSSPFVVVLDGKATLYR